MIITWQGYDSMLERNKMRGQGGVEWGGEGMTKTINEDCRQKEVLPKDSWSKYKFNTDPNLTFLEKVTEVIQWQRLKRWTITPILNMKLNKSYNMSKNPEQSQDNTLTLLTFYL